MGKNKLKLNPDKTEFIVIGDDQIRSSLKASFPVSLLGNSMDPAKSWCHPGCGKLNAKTRG